MLSLGTDALLGLHALPRPRALAGDHQRVALHRHLLQPLQRDRRIPDRSAGPEPPGGHAIALGVIGLAARPLGRLLRPTAKARRGIRSPSPRRRCRLRGWAGGFTRALTRPDSIQQRNALDNSISRFSSCRRSQSKSLAWQLSKPPLNEGSSVTLPELYSLRHHTTDKASVPILYTAHIRPGDNRLRNRLQSLHLCRCSSGMSLNLIRRSFYILPFVVSIDQGLRLGPSTDCENCLELSNSTNSRNTATPEA